MRVLRAIASTAEFVLGIACALVTAVALLCGIVAGALGAGR